MATITIDNKSYDTETLSEEVRGQLASLQFVDGEIMRLQAQLAAMQTARMAYANALKAELAKADPLAGDTIQFPT